MSNDVISIGNELKLFEVEKQKLLEKYNIQINNSINSEEKISCYMTAIIYEYERLKPMGKLFLIGICLKKNLEYQ